MLKYLLYDVFIDKHQLYDLLNAIYYFCIFSGIFVASYCVRKKLLRLGYSTRKTNVLALVLLLTLFPAGFVSSRLAALFSSPVETWNLALLAQLIVSGHTHAFHASLVFPALMILCVLVFLKFDLLLGFDVLILHLPLAHAIGRVGCLLVGCCWGHEITVCLLNKVYTFQNPVPLYAILFNCCLFLGLHKVFNAVYLAGAESFFSNKRGMIPGLYFLSYGIFRFFIEFYRTNPVLSVGLTLPQSVMLVFILLGVVITSLALKGALQSQNLHRAVGENACKQH